MDDRVAREAVWGRRLIWINAVASVLLLTTGAFNLAIGHRWGWVQLAGGGAVGTALLLYYKEQRRSKDQR